MPSSRPDDKDSRDSDRRVGALASRALSVLAERRTAERHLCPDTLAALSSAVCDPDPEARDRIINEMLAAGHGREEICDLYIPEAARRLGEAWRSDRTSFATVTIGAARLQSLVRELTRGTEPDPSHDAQRLMVLVVGDEHHTLGATVLTAQLRRIGASVRLSLGASTEETVRTARAVALDAVLISVALRDDLSEVADTIAALRAVLPPRVPVIVGGGIVAHGAERVRRQTGADHVTSDPHDAVTFGARRTERVAT